MAEQKETAEQLIARINKEYGLNSSATAPPPEQPQSPPKPAPAQKTEGGILGGAMGIIRNRQQQIDKAAGYARGGIVRGKGGVDNVPMSIGGKNVKPRQTCSKELTC